MERKRTIKKKSFFSKLAEQDHRQKDLKYWREQILFVLLSVGLAVGFFVFLPMAFMAIREGLWFLLTLNATVLILSVVLLIFRRIPYEIRALFLVLLAFCVGCYVIYHFGLLSGGPIWLFTSCVMAGLLLGIKTTIATLMINGATLLIFVWLGATGRWGQELPFFTNTLRGLVTWANFMLLNGVAAFSSMVLIKGLDETGKREKVAKTKLKEEHEKLQNEIKERIRADEALRASEKRYRLLAENVTDIIWTLNLENMAFTYFSPSVFRMRGFTPEEAMKLPLEEQLAPGSVEGVVKTLAEELASDGNKGVAPDRSMTLEVEQTCKDGSYGWVEVTVTFVRDEEGKAVELLGVSRDIGERKRREKEREVLEARLQQSQKMEAIATLAGGIAHQFNNGLSVIMGRLDLLEMDLTEEVITENIQPIRKSARLLTALTSQLLAYARGGKYQAREISLGDLVNATLPLVKRLTKPSIQVEADLPEDTFLVVADAIQMQMVISAVLSNASEAMEKGGHIHISCENQNITSGSARLLTGLKPGAYVRLSIEDDGKGMDEETRAHLFEPFFSTKFQGRGLGMAAVYGIVKNHGGSIYVESEPGKGTTVSIYLPAIEKTGRTPKAAPQVSVKDAKVVLLIEDEEMVMEVNCAFLERMGYEVLKAGTGRETLAAIDSFEGEIDLALLDIVLPDMDGREIYEQLMKKRPGLKVIVCSGYPVDGPAREMLDLGAEGFIQKPFAFEKLEKKVKDVLKGTDDHLGG